MARTTWRHPRRDIRCNLYVYLPPPILLTSLRHLIHSRTAESSRAQQNLATATSELNRIKGEKSEAESTIVKIFHPEHFGIEGEWKKMDDECLEYEYGE
jgi:hypothetical protein